MKQSSKHQRKKKKIRNSITIEIPLDEIEIKLWLSVAKLSDAKLSDGHL